MFDSRYDPERLAFLLMVPRSQLLTMPTTVRLAWQALCGTDYLRRSLN
ncbi:MAG: hypothetical protein AAGG50_18505 [Bacteroidota bacterium]